MPTCCAPCPENKIPFAIRVILAHETEFGNFFVSIDRFPVKKNEVSRAE